MSRVSAPTTGEVIRQAREFFALPEPAVPRVLPADDGRLGPAPMHALSESWRTGADLGFMLVIAAP